MCYSLHVTVIICINCSIFTFTLNNIGTFYFLLATCGYVSLCAHKMVFSMHVCRRQIEATACMTNPLRNTSSASFVYCVNLPRARRKVTCWNFPLFIFTYFRFWWRCFCGLTAASCTATDSRYNSMRWWWRCLRLYYCTVYMSLLCRFWIWYQST